MQPYVIGIILLGLLLLVGMWYTAQPTEPQKTLNLQEEVVDVPFEKQAFIPADNFQGSRPGYVYKMDAKGLGYYIDHYRSSS